MTRTHFLLSTALGWLTLTTSSAVAQAPTTAPKVRTEQASKSPDEKASVLTQRMTKHLTLTPDQQTRISALNTQLTTDLGAVRAARKADQAAKGERRAKAQQIRTAYEANLKALLTPDQYGRYEQQRTEQEQKKHARHAGRHAAQGPKGGRSIPPGQPQLSPPAQD
ncbi:MAG: hypothetical protein H7330_17005 [Hymenobacteraceae bacterium]|nr:hypothetical protein [Hymenobacteraceae bacterium]